MKKLGSSPKDEIRKVMKMMRNELSESYVIEKSKLISDNLFSLTILKNASVILAYYSFNKEVCTHGIIEELLSLDKKVALPVCIKSKDKFVISCITSLQDLKLGSLGIMEPDPEKLELVKPEDINVVLVPGIAFDRKGNRLGYGKGYYDRFLAELDSSKIKVGICFDFQIIDELPTDCFDVPVDCIVTEFGVIDIL